MLIKMKLKLRLRNFYEIVIHIPSGGSKGAPQEPAPLRFKIFSISCNFWEIFTKSYVGAPLGGRRSLLQGILDPPLYTIDS